MAKEIEHLEHQLAVSEFYRTESMRLSAESLRMMKSPHFVYSVTSFCSSSLRIGDTLGNAQPQALSEQFRAAMSRRLSRAWINLLASSIKPSDITLLPVAGIDRPTYKLTVILSDKEMAAKLSAFYESPSFAEMMQSFHCQRYRLSDPLLHR